MDTTPRHTPFLFTFDHTYIFQLHYGFNRHLKNLSLITHEINVLSDTLSSALCPFDGNRCAQTLCAVTGFMSSVYEYIHLLRSAVMTSYRDRDQHLPWPERLFSSSWIRGKIRNSRERLNVLFSSIATKIIGYVRHTVQ